MCILGGLEMYSGLVKHAHHTWIASGRNYCICNILAASVPCSDPEADDDKPLAGKSASLQSCRVDGSESRQAPGNAVESGVRLRAIEEN
jgi:hypothetical protein